MNICILRHAYFPEDPTVRKEVYALLEEGHRVDILCLRKNDQSLIENINGARIYRIPISHRRAGIIRYFFEYFLSFVLMSFWLLYLFVKNKYDFIQVNTMPDFLVFSTIIPKLLGAKIILHLHEPTPELWITKFGINKHKWLLFAQIKTEQLAIKYADHCFTVTEALRRRFGERGADLDKVSVIPNVCEEKTFSYSERYRVHLKDGKFRLVTHGLIEERSGHEIIINAVYLLKSKLLNLHFEIIGEGEYREKIEKLVKKLKCSDRVHFSGFVSTEELLKKIRSANIGIIAVKRSPYSELIDTTKMYEYLALRKPLIASRLPAVEDNFDESCIMYFEPGDYEDLARCILKIYNKPEIRNNLIKNAYLEYEKIRWNKTKVKYLKVFQELL